jgi:hypothetical protein
MALAVPPRNTVVRQLRPVIARHLGIVLRREKVLDRGLRVALDALSMLRIS